MTRHTTRIVAVLGSLSAALAAEAGSTIDLAASELRAVFLDKRYDPPKHEGWTLPGVANFAAGDYEYWMGGTRDGLLFRHVPSKTYRLALPFALAESLGAKLVGGEHRPNRLRGLFKAGGHLWMGTNGVGILRLDMARQLWSRFDIKDEAVAGHHQSLIYCDDAYLFAASGWHRQLEAAKPSLHVFSHAAGRWAKVVRVTTRNAVLGHSPKSGITSVGWDYSRLGEQPFVEVPIMGGFANSPDRIEFDKESGEYLLRFNSGWKEPGVETRLRFRKADLDAHFRQGPR